MPGSFIAQIFAHGRNKFAPRLFRVEEKLPMKSPYDDLRQRRVELELLPGRPVSEVMLGKSHFERKKNFSRTEQEKFQAAPGAKGVTKEWVHANRGQIVRQLATITAALCENGVLHGHLKDEQVLIAKTRNGKPRISIIDWEFARSGTPFEFEERLEVARPQHDYQAMARGVLKAISNGLPGGELGKMQQNFREHFEAELAKRKPRRGALMFRPKPV